ncbi:MAG TPA: flavin reductase family protein [Solirubrobacteraceae bacterium]|jgi:flavin reductase (DIM6/NTAB) family NADH-FMN oxidoreductase RutF
MELAVDLTARPARPRLVDASPDSLTLVLLGPGGPPAIPGVAGFDEHAWVRVETLRELAGEPAAAALLERARAGGWLDEATGAVRARCERRPAVAAAVEEDPTCDRTVFREVVGHFATGVAVVTARRDGVDHGLTASAVASLSLEPPMLLVCLNRASVTHGALWAAGAYGVNVLTDAQAAIAIRFAGRDRQTKFAGLQVHYGPLGQPLLTDTLARLECRVTETVSGGTHTVFLGRVAHAEAAAGAPLTYFRGRFGRFLDPVAG